MRTDMNDLQVLLLAPSCPGLPGHPRLPSLNQKDEVTRPAMTTDSGLFLIPKIRLDRPVNFDSQLVAVAVFGAAGGDADPALADAIFLDIGLLDALETDADIARQDLRVVVRAVRIDRQAVRQLLVHDFVHDFVLGFVLRVQSSASMSCLIPCGVAVGAKRATTLPDRSTRNLVKFHLMDEPSRPDFSLFR